MFKAMPRVDVVFLSLLASLMHRMMLHKACSRPRLAGLTSRAHSGGRKEPFFVVLPRGCSEQKQKVIRFQLYVCVYLGRKGNMLAEARMNLMPEPKRLLRHLPTPIIEGR